MYNEENMDLFNKMIIAGIMYPAILSFVEIYKSGIVAYFSDGSNYMELVYVWAGLINVLLQNSMSPFSFYCKFVMSQIMLQQIIKTFNYLRIMKNLSYLTTMLRNVIFDLLPFGVLFVMLIFLISMTFCVLGAGNENLPGAF